MSADAIVVLGCRVRDDGRPGAFLAARVRTAVPLLAENPGAKLVLSGGRRWGEVSECEAMEQLALTLGARRTVIVREERSMTTFGNALETRRLVGSGARVVLVTQAFHVERAARLFRAAGLQTDCALAPTPPTPALTWARLLVTERIASTLDRLRMP